MANSRSSSKRVRFADMVTSAGATRKARGWTAGDEGVERYVGLEHLDSNSPKIRRWGSAEAVGENSDLRHFEPGDVLLARRGIEQRKVGMAQFRGVASGHALVFRARPELVVPEFLPYFLLSDLFMERALRFSAGSLSKTVNLSALMKQEFALPTLQEQERTARLLVALDGTVDAYAFAVEQAEPLAAAMAERLFPVSEVRSTDRKRELVPLGLAATCQVGYPFKSSDYADRGDRLLRGSNVGVQKLTWGTEVTRYWPVARRGEVADYVLKQGDIVIAMDRPFISEGFKIARVASSDLPALLLQRVGRLLVRSGWHDGYLWAFLKSPSFRWQLQQRQQGTDLPHISKYDIEAALIPRLSLEEQKAAALALRSCQKAIEPAKQRLVAARDTRTVVIREALRSV